MIFFSQQWVVLQSYGYTHYIPVKKGNCFTKNIWSPFCHLLPVVPPNDLQGYHGQNITCGTPEGELGGRGPRVTNAYCQYDPI